MKTWQLLKKDPNLFKRYYVKEYIIKAVRKFFENKSYHELESPILSAALPQERYLDVLETKIELANDTTQKAYLIPTTETFNKKILAAGLGNHFVITKVARGLEQIGPNHSPEFTMLEWYHLYSDYMGLMQDSEELLQFIQKFLTLALSTENNNLKDIFSMSFQDINQIQTDMTFQYQNNKISLESSWDRISIPDALNRICGIRLEEIQELEDFRRVARSKGYNIDETDGWQIIFELIFANEIEPTFSPNKPTFVYNYPKIMCPLTKVNSKNPLVSEKVELYLGGKEVANGYTELLDWQQQEKNFLAEKEARKKLGMRDIKMDLDLIGAIRSGLPPVAGIGMGLDRLAMIFADAANISEINYFPASEMFETL
jgi:elongation factor P--beta-lysine ligase